jgi:hypothetical protein
MLETYRHTGQEDLLAGSLKWYDYLFSNVGFTEAGGGLAINYFANVPTGPVPNNSTLALAFLGQLAQITGDDHYLKNCPEMITFLDWCQLPTGEFPYQMKDANGAGRDRVHFQCFQYHAFQLQDLAMYHDATGDDRVLPLIANVARFLAPCVNPDGSTQFSCTDYTTRVNYNTAAIAAALGIARRKGAGNYLEVENRAYSYVLANQQPNGGFAYSNREYQVLSDRRFYPRTLSMVLYHLMLKARENQQTASSKSESTPQTQPAAQTQPTPDITAPGVQTTPTS